MSIRVECPSCHKAIQAPEKYRSKKISCPGCKRPLIIPAEQSSASISVVEKLKVKSVKPKAPREGSRSMLSALAFSIGFLAAGFISGMGFAQWMNSKEVSQLEQDRNRSEEHLKASEQSVRELREILEGFESSDPTEKIVTISGDESGHSSAVGNPTAKFLGVSRATILEGLQRLYTLRNVDATSTRFQAVLGQDNVIQISGTETNVRSFLVFGSLTTANAQDMGRVMYTAWETILPGDNWLAEWLPNALTKVDVGYTVSTTHSGLDVSLDGVILDETALIMLNIAPSE